jgi:ATP-dependent exoDNAse (exonuclease V) beta subunit
MNLEDFIKLEDSFSDIRFLAKNHSYKIGNETAKYSVTKLLKKYEKPFESDKIAERVARKRGILKEAVLKEWDFKRDYSTHKGSEFHLFAENYLQRRQIQIDQEAIRKFLKERGEDIFVEDYYNEIALLVKNFLQFYDWWKKDYILLKTEFVIGDKDASVCGTIDNLSYNRKTKKLAIFDYKTNKKIGTSSDYNNKLLSPFEHLDECELVKYSLQLWLYKHMIEKNTGFEVEPPHIVWVTGTEGYELIPTIDMSKEVKYILENA